MFAEIREKIIDIGECCTRFSLYRNTGGGKVGERVPPFSALDKTFDSEC